MPVTKKQSQHVRDGTRSELLTWDPTWPGVIHLGPDPTRPAQWTFLKSLQHSRTVSPAEYVTTPKDSSVYLQKSPEMRRYTVLW